MAGNIFAKERTAVVLTSTGASLTSGSAAAAGTNFSALAAGNAADDLQAQFELLAQWASPTGIVGGTVVAELYLVPAVDGTNFAAVDTTAGASRLPMATYVGAFEAALTPTAATNMRFVTPAFPIAPRLYKAYVKNTSGLAMSANWSLTVVSDQAQYT